MERVWNQLDPLLDDLTIRHPGHRRQAIWTDWLPALRTFPEFVVVLKKNDGIESLFLWSVARLAARRLIELENT